MVQIYWDQCKSIGTLMQCPKVGVIRVHVFGFGFWNHSIWWDKGWRGCGYLPNTQTDNSAFKQLNAPLHWPSQTDAGTPRARSFAGQIPVVLTFLALNTPQKAAFFFFFFLSEATSGQFSIQSFPDASPWCATDRNVNFSSMTDTWINPLNDSHTQRGDTLTHAGGSARVWRPQNIF